MNSYIEDPLEEYKSYYKEAHKKNVAEYIDDIILQSNINVDENRETNKNIEDNKVKYKKISLKLTIYKIIRLILILLIFLAVFFILIYSDEESDIRDTVAIDDKYVYISVFLIVLILIYLLIKNFFPKISHLHRIQADIGDKTRDLELKAWRQLAPLNAFFTESICRDLFNKTISVIKLDPNFDIKKMDWMINYFGLDDDNDKNFSTQFVQSGDLNGNPFYFCTDLMHEMGTKTYSNSIIITWTTNSFRDGKIETDYHSEVLTATIEKPCPYYTERTYLIYANDAAPNLKFSREDSDAEIMSENQIKKLVNKKSKHLRKLSENAVQDNINFTLMGNTEFEVLFGALNRNSETQFRLLFTPLAQKQLLNLMKDKTVGFGDNFDIIKDNKINYIFPEHLERQKLDYDSELFRHCNIDKLRDNFIKFNNYYFKSIYFALAPILCIPLYKQHKPNDYAYKDSYDSKFSRHEHEMIANIDIDKLKHPSSTTQNILKTSFIKTIDGYDLINVEAYGYSTKNRCEVVSRYGGDGHFHNISVDWVEYIPVVFTTEHKIKHNRETTYEERYKKIIKEIEDKFKKLEV